MFSLWYNFLRFHEFISWFVWVAAELHVCDTRNIILFIESVFALIFTINFFSSEGVSIDLLMLSLGLITMPTKEKLAARMTSTKCFTV